MVAVVLLLAAAQPDSLAILRTARNAQEAFESRRRLLAPRRLGRSGGVCDERIGRFCYWYVFPDPLPREPEGIISARNWLLTILDSAATQAPGDWWIAGQRVRYLVEGQRLPESIAAARACRAERWWCEALEGFARHAAGDDVGADSAYAAALEDMPADQRCRWTDLSPLLEGTLRQQFTKLGCDARAAFAAHVWWLAQPLISHAGNDRRVEHFARLTMVRMLERAGSVWATPVADDLRELTLRYGWPIAWTGDLGVGLQDDPGISGHERQPAFHFFPDVEPRPDGAQAWSLLPPRPKERYAPLYAEVFADVPADVTILHHGDSTFAVVSYDLTRDTLWTHGSALRATAVLARDERTPTVVVSADDSIRRGVLVVKAPWRATLAEFEVAQPGARRVGRLRLPVAPSDPTHVGVSDLLVFDPVDSLPRDMAAVLPLVRGPARVKRGGRFGLYWELYGLAPGEPIESTVHVSPLGTGLFRRLGAVLGLGKRVRSAGLAWHEMALPIDGVVHRAVVVDVTGLAPGRYRIAVTATARGQDVTESRELEIVP